MALLDEDILGLHIAVQEAALVDEFQGIEQERA